MIVMTYYFNIFKLVNHNHPMSKSPCRSDRQYILGSVKYCANYSSDVVQAQIAYIHREIDRAWEAFEKTDSYSNLEFIDFLIKNYGFQKHEEAIDHVVG